MALLEGGTGLEEAWHWETALGSYLSLWFFPVVFVSWPP